MVTPAGGTPEGVPDHKLRTMPLDWLQVKLKLGRDAPLLHDQPSSMVLMGRLEQAEQPEAALCLAAHALPPREAVWWACMCARHTAQPSEALDTAAREAAEIWVRRPDEAARARAFRLAQQARFQTAEALAALAVFWTAAATTLSMPDEAARGQFGRSIENAARMASLRGAPPERPARLRAFLASARDIARGGAGHLDMLGGDTSRRTET